jgi:cytochrome c oxidase assembly protein subunit 15
MNQPAGPPAARDAIAFYAPALGLGTAVTMWALAYLCRLPVVMAPAWLLLVLLLTAVVAWGWTTGRLTAGGWRAGAAVGFTAAMVNLLVLGSLLTSDQPNRVVPSALWWVPGSLVTVAGLAAVASVLASRRRGATARPAADWIALLSKVTVGATFLLVVAGGLVTSAESGLAVVDWPNTFGYSMFLYPLSRMTGGVYYEHAHRLFGSLVGLTTVVLALQLLRGDRRPEVRRAGLVAVVVVVAQGVLGGLRVTGRFTFSTAAEDMAPSLVLAAVHGVLGQLFLALVVGLAVVTSRLWKGSQPPTAHPAAASDRVLAPLLMAVLVVQLAFGAVQRHFAQGLMVHITMAVVVTVLALAVGARAWGLYEGGRPLPALGRWLMGTVAVQVALGIAALATTQGRAVVGAPGTLEITVATAHQACGALLLGLAVATWLWQRRLASVA